MTEPSLNDTRPSDSDRIEQTGPWPFVTRRVYRLADQSSRIWSLRHHRKSLLVRGLSEGEQLGSILLRCLWMPGKLNWWIGIVFAIGSLLFALASVVSFLSARHNSGFHNSLSWDVTTKHLLSVHGQPAKAVNQPERTGIVRTCPFDKAPGAYFDLGNAVLRRETQLAMPAIGLDFATSSLAVSADPYTGTAFSAKPLEKDKEQYTQISLSTIYRGWIIPLAPEERTMAPGNDPRLPQQPMQL